MKVIFISMDTVSADRLSCLGSNKVRTPHIDSFFADGALFTGAFASDIPTQPSHTAMFTGRFGVTTGIVSHFHPPARLDEAVPWLPSLLRERGCRTAAVDHLFAMKDWFIRGYDDYMAPPGRSRAPASVVNDLAFPWLQQHSDEDFFLFLHYWDAHIPYVPPEPFRRRYTMTSENLIDSNIQQKIRSRPSYPLFKRNLYDHLDRMPNLDYIADLHYAEIAYLDYELGNLFNYLAYLGIIDDTLIVAFGDHGEVMTEHDSWFDHAGLYDSVVHVPLAIRAPGHVRPQRIGALVQSVDVMPTVLELLGLDDVAHQASGDGISMTKLLRGEATEHRDAVMLSEATWEAKRGIRTKDWKLIRCYDAGIYGRRSRELYNVSADPDEQNNQIATSTDVARELGQRLDRWLDEHLQGRPDPLQEVVEYGLPAVARLDNVIREDAQIARRSSADADESLPVAEAGGQFLEKADRRRGVLRPGRSAARNVDPIAVDR